MKYRVIAAIALGVCSSSCTRKAEGQTVAVVNGEEITVPDLNFALTMTKAPEGADEKDVRSQVLQQLIDRRLLAEQARKDAERAKQPLPPEPEKPVKDKKFILDPLI